MDNHLSNKPSLDEEKLSINMKALEYIYNIYSQFQIHLFTHLHDTHRLIFSTIDIANQLHISSKDSDTSYQITKNNSWKPSSIIVIENNGDVHDANAKELIEINRLIAKIYEYTTQFCNDKEMIQERVSQLLDVMSKK